LRIIKLKILANFCLFYLFRIDKNILTFLPTVKSRNQANRCSQCSLVLFFNALFTLERGFITNVYGLSSGHHFYIQYVMFLKYALDLSFLANVDILCTDLLVTTRLVYKI
jgi:hypothetical protein